MVVGWPARVTLTTAALFASVWLLIHLPAVSAQTVQGQLTASFEAVPDNHDGETTITVRVWFSAPIGGPLAGSSLRVTNGTVASVTRVDNRSDLWDLAVTPTSYFPLSIAIPGDRSCDDSGAVCTRDGRQLADGIEVSIPSAPVYLTFDDGPHPVRTPEILDVLARYDARGTFFVTGDRATTHPKIIDRIVAEGHTLGNHTWGHERLTELSLSKFNDTVTRTQAVLGRNATPCLRPPYFSMDSTTYERAEALGLQIIGFTVNPKDWQEPGVEVLANRIVAGATPGALIVLHDGWDFNGEPGAALEIALHRLAPTGLRFEPVCHPVNAAAEGRADDRWNGRGRAHGIEALEARGVLAGTECAESGLCPGAATLRWVMAVWLVRIIDGVDPDSATGIFEDVDPAVWWAPHVERLAELGVTVGCKSEPLEFCPQQAVTRAQTATFLVRAFALAPAGSAGFTDTAGNFHEADIDALAAARITAGCNREPLEFCPHQMVTRAQMAVFLARALSDVAP